MKWGSYLVISCAHTNTLYDLSSSQDNILGFLHICDLIQINISCWSLMSWWDRVYTWYWAILALAGVCDNTTFTSSSPLSSLSHCIHPNLATAHYSLLPHHLPNIQQYKIIDFKWYALQQIFGVSFHWKMCLWCADTWWWRMIA